MTPEVQVLLGGNGQGKNPDLLATLIRVRRHTATAPMVIDPKGARSVVAISTQAPGRGHRCTEAQRG